MRALTLIVLLLLFATGSVAATQGTSENDPLYVTAKCEHGCGYSEDNKGWWQKFWTDPNATFSGAVALFTLCLFGAAWWQGRLISDQIKLARDEFNATHRPKLILRKAYAIGPKADDMITIQYTVANVGESRAKIVGVKVEAMVVNQSEARLNHIMSPNPVLDRHLGEIFEAAESKSFEYKASQKWTQDVVSGAFGIKCYFSGRIVYVDENGIKRETVFCRPYDVQGFRFRNPDDKELDYAD